MTWAPPPCPVCQGPVHVSNLRRYSGACSDDHGSIVELGRELRRAREVTESWGRETMRLIEAIQASLRDPTLCVAQRRHLADAIDPTKRPQAFPMPSASFTEDANGNDP